MTPAQLFARLDQLRGALRSIAAGTIALWAMSAAALILLSGTLARQMFGSPGIGVIWGLAATIAAVVATWRWRAVRPDTVRRLDAALWAESQAPALRYALVTLAEQPNVDDANPTQRRLAAYATITAWLPAVDRALSLHRRRLLLRGALVTAVALLAAFPWRTRSLDARALARRVAATAGATIRGRVAADAVLIPPVYSGRAERPMQFGETVAALAGSVIRIDARDAQRDGTLMVQESSDSGAGAPRQVVTLPTDAGWRGLVRVGTVPLAIRLRDPAGERWLLVTPVADSAPVATLVLPAADTLVLDTMATIRVSGRIHDDLGLRDARVEYIISSGGGEQFTFKSGVMNERRGPLGQNLVMDATLNLGKLGLKPGDLMHVRLTAHDGNTLSGPSLGVSETRTIRIPRLDERDSVSVEQLPPTPVDKSVLSQRQLLLLTERLVARIPKIDRATMLAESQRIGADQARLRKQVADIVFARLGDTPTGEHAHYPGDGHDHNAAELASTATPEDILKAADRATGGLGGMLDSHGDETPVVAVNRPLLEAYNAMWDATRALQGGVPRDALDPMRRALAAIQRARSAERVYLRGTPPAAVVNLAKVRLIGTDSAKFEQRRALDALPPTERRLAERTLRALALLIARDSTAADTLRLLRLDALGGAGPLASVLGSVIDAVDGRRDATAAILRARRLALTPWQRSGTPGLWLGGAP